MNILRNKKVFEYIIILILLINICNGQITIEKNSSIFHRRSSDGFHQGTYQGSSVVDRQFPGDSSFLGKFY